MTTYFDQLSTAFPNIVFEQNKELAPLTYFKIGGPAEVFCTVTDISTLHNLITLCTTSHIPHTILGGASNVVISDKGIQGLVIKNELDSIKEIETSESNGTIYAESGIKMATLVSKTVTMGYTGLEYFLGIPGTLGGATYNNGHYLSHLIGAYISRVLVISENGELTWLSHDECQFGYDSSRFHKTKETIVAVEFKLDKGSTEISKKLIKEATMYRAQTQPLGIPSSGCIFQNTPNTPHLKSLFPQFADKEYIPTGFLIDQAGLKGYGIGSVKVSEKHGAWIVNNGSGKAEDVKNLIIHIKKVVKELFQVDIKEEVFYLGEK